MPGRLRLRQPGALRLALVLALAATLAALGLVLSTTSTAAPPSAPSISRATFGSTNGQNVDIYTLTNSKGMEVKILTYGGIIQSVKVPDKSQRLANVTLGFDNLDDYVTRNPYFGCITGRYANRIALGQFSLNGVTYQLPINNPPNSLHGGTIGFDKHIWSASVIPATSSSVGLRLTFTSPDGDQGYPAQLAVEVDYLLTNDNEIRITYEATNQSSTLSTVVNLTNHAYWNLKGEGTGTILDHNLALNSSTYTPVDETLIPTGEFRNVQGSPFDFTKSTAIGARIHDDDEQILIGQGYDHNFVLDRPNPNDTSLILAAHVQEPSTHRILDILTTEPGIQFYSGNFLDGTLVGPSGHTYRQTDGFALETQHYPDSPNHQGDPDWPSTVLGPGQTYDSMTIYKFSTGPK
jgi:aldose 1-epimerase